jgi:hypothetical protein
MTRRSQLVWIAAVLVLLAVTLGISLQLIPTLIYQGRDSGIVAYTSHRVLKGDILYREVWDNKPPVIYYLNALAFSIVGTNRWALWWVDTLSVYVAALVVFWLVRRAFEWWPLPWLGALAMILWARNPGIVWDTIFTEVIALPFQMLCFALGYEFLRRPQARTGFLLGLASCAAFLTKQTTAGVALAFVPAVVLSRHPLIQMPQRWRWLATIMAGGLLGLGVVALFFAVQGALDEGFRAAFQHPRLFHQWVSDRSIPWLETVKISMRGKVVPHVFGPAWPFWLGGAMAASWYLILKPSDPGDNGQGFKRAALSTLIIWAGITAATDLALMNLTARGYEHYYVSWIPSLTLMMVITLSALQKLRRWWLVYPMLGIFGLYMVFAAGWTALKTLRSEIRNDKIDLSGPMLDYGVAGYVHDHTQPGDTVLVWGASTSINFQSGRDAPSRFHYGYALIAPNFTTDEQIDQFVADLQANHPVLIVDRTMTDGNRIPPLAADRRMQWIQRGGRSDTTDLTPLYDFYETYCTTIDIRYTNGTIVYRCSY